MFYCENKGHIPGWIPSNRVNDGVCDYDVCCDGSDEYGLDSSLCPNRCKEINEKYVAEQKTKRELLAVGLKARQEYIAKADDIRDSMQKEVMEKEAKLVEDKQNLENLKVELELAIEKHREEMIQSGKTAEEIDVPPEIADVVNNLRVLEDANKEAFRKLIELRNKYTEIREVLERLKDGYNPNFNDPVVKEAVRSWDDFKDYSHSEISLLSFEAGLNSAIESLEAYRPVHSADEKQFSLLALLPAPLRLMVEPTLESFSQWLRENGLLAYPSEGGKSTNEPEAVASIRKSIERTESAISDSESSIEKILTDLNISYGQNDVLRGLKDECVNDKIGEYDYEFCFFKSASQNGNGHHSSLGSYSKMEIDDESGKITMQFDNGARCWNGPIRKANVHITCGPVNKITSVSEPERCEYFFKATSPAACLEPESDSALEEGGIVHNEL